MEVKNKIVTFERVVMTVALISGIFLIYDLSKKHNII